MPDEGEGGPAPGLREGAAPGEGKQSPLSGLRVYGLTRCPGGLRSGGRPTAAQRAFG